MIATLGVAAIVCQCPLQMFKHQKLKIVGASPFRQQIKQIAGVKLPRPAPMVQLLKIRLRDRKRIIRTRLVYSQAWLGDFLEMEYYHGIWCA